MSDNAFATAQSKVKQLSSTPTPAELLELYSLFKQGQFGDVQGKRPGLLDVRGRAKYDAWSKKRGVGAEEAQRLYVELVETLEKKYG